MVLSECTTMPIPRGQGQETEHGTRKGPKTVGEQMTDMELQGLFALIQSLFPPSGMRMFTLYGNIEVHNLFDYTGSS